MFNGLVLAIRSPNPVPGRLLWASVAGNKIKLRSTELVPDFPIRNANDVVPPELRTPMISSLSARRNCKNKVEVHEAMSTLIAISYLLHSEWGRQIVWWVITCNCGEVFVLYSVED